MKRFLDTNVLVYAFGEDGRSEIARGILREGGLIAVQSLNEFADVARRKLAMEWPEVADAINSLVALCDLVEAVPAEVQMHGVEIAERYRLRIFDAVLLAIALRAGCGTFLSEDLHDGLVIDGRMEVRNPFLARV